MNELSFQHKIRVVILLMPLIFLSQCSSKENRLESTTRMSRPARAFIAFRTPTARDRTPVPQ